VTPQNILWVLGTGYGGRGLYPGQVFFSMAGKKDGWLRLVRDLWAEVDEEFD